MNIRNFCGDIWELRGVSVEGIVAGQDDSGCHALFGKPEIPLSYMRSCLLSPKFYKVVNSVLARMISSDTSSPHMRSTILHFLNKIIKLDRDIVPLVLNDIDLEAFLKINMFTGESSGI